MPPTVGDIVKMMDRSIAPRYLAESWDNCGLQVGDKKWGVNKIRLALDPSLKTVERACTEKIDLLITHHPLLFKPLSAVDFQDQKGQVIRLAALHELAIFSAHTNLDSVAGGLNDILAQKIGLTRTTVLGSPLAPEKVKLVVFVPKDHLNRIQEALRNTSAGVIGNYTGCTFYTEGTGTFRPNDQAEPFMGDKGELATVEEFKLETVVDFSETKHVLQKIKEAHPYEEMAYDIVPLGRSIDANQGLGRIGELTAPMRLDAFAGLVKDRLSLSGIKMGGRPDLTVSRVAVCSGSGSSLIPVFFASGAQVYITGDVRYHDASEITERGLAVIDIGHFASEHLYLETLKSKLEYFFEKQKICVRVDICPYEKDPLCTL